MLKLIVVAILVFAVMTTIVEVGDRHGFSPLSKLARAFDARPAIAVVPPLTVSDLPPTTPAPTGTDESAA